MLCSGRTYDHAVRNVLAEAAIDPELRVSFRSESPAWFQCSECDLLSAEQLSGTLTPFQSTFGAVPNGRGAPVESTIQKYDRLQAVLNDPSLATSCPMCAVVCRREPTGLFHRQLHAMTCTECSHQFCFVHGALPPPPPPPPPPRDTHHSTAHRTNALRRCPQATTTLLAPLASALS